MKYLYALIVLLLLSGTAQAGNYCYNRCYYNNNQFAVKETIIIPQRVVEIVEVPGLKIVDTAAYSALYSHGGQFYIRSNQAAKVIEKQIVLDNYVPLIRIRY